MKKSVESIFARHLLKRQSAMNFLFLKRIPDTILTELTLKGPRKEVIFSDLTLENKTAFFKSAQEQKEMLKFALSVLTRTD